MELEHAAAVQSLAPHHADPFDWLLVAQAQLEPMRLLAHEMHLARQDPAVVRV